MIGSLVIALLVISSGTVATYLYDSGSPFSARVCSGSCLGITALGLLGFVFASFLGLNGTSVLVTTVVCSLPLFLLTRQTYFDSFKQDAGAAYQAVRRFVSQPDLKTSGYVAFYLFTIAILWRVFSKAMIQDENGISTGLLNNFGDLPFHLSIITGFAFGNNFPPEDPTYAGVRFTYPFLSDFVSAIFVQCRADLTQSMFLENMILAVSFVGLLHRWAYVLLRDKLAAIITPLLVLLNGGFGWVMLYTREGESTQLLGFLSKVPSFTIIPETTWRWGNAISTLLIPQRGFLMGLPLAIIVFTQWWLAADNEVPRQEVSTSKRPNRKTKGQAVTARALTVQNAPMRRMIAAGIIAGLIPLAHAHTFVVVMGMAGCLALIERRWRLWIAFFIAAGVIAGPQLLWSTSYSAVNASSFFAWEIGWDRGKDNPILFWFKNTGLFIPLLLVAILVRGKTYLISKRLLLFYLPFTLCFVVPNFIKMAPWIWDNIKVLFYWWVASAPLVAILLSKLWQDNPVRKLMAVVLFACLVLAGSLDVAKIAFTSDKYGIFDMSGVKFAELVKSGTAPRALILHAPVHNEPIFLTGRKSLMGYPGHIWTHGLEFAPRENDIKRIYAGAPNAEQLLRTYKIDYAVVGPLERLVMPVNEQFFSRFTKVGDIGGYQLYKIKP